VDVLTVIELWLAGAALGAFLVVQPIPPCEERHAVMRWIHLIAIIACAFYLAAPAFPLTAKHVGWPWCAADDLIVTWVVVRIALAWRNSKAGKWLFFR
jgi:hypothetical protein